VNEHGSAGLTLIGVAAVVLLLVAALGSVGAYLNARVQVSAAADAAALAAAPVTFLPFGAPGGPAEEAARFAALNGAELVECTCPVDRSWEARTVTVEVAREVGLGPFGTVRVTARSRAEFVPALLLAGSGG
jgi:secretion/DNA translocation related TadE-like protein